jgi:tRNA-specific 2-thiouridylase
MAKIAVLVSGGVDSACAALVLKRQGHELTGVTARLWRETESPSVGDGDTARAVCRRLGIPHVSVDLASDFERCVVGPFVASYLKGRTPNPCALCNRDLKLGKLVELALQRGFQRVATGHYAGISRIEGHLTFREPADKVKTQVYFLSLVHPDTLRWLELPLEGLLKAQVRRMSNEAELPYRKHDSQDLCFVTNGRYSDLLKDETAVSGRGNVLDMEGHVVGAHDGHFAYTIGQRLGIRGKRYYVIEKRAGTNEIVVAERDNALRHEISVSSPNLFVPLESFRSEQIDIKYRYNSPAVGAKVTDASADALTVVTEEPCFGPAPGQVLAGYRDGFLLFGAIIESAR